MMKIINLNGAHTFTVSGVAIINGIATVRTEEEETLVVGYLEAAGIPFTSEEYDETNPVHNPKAAPSQAVTGMMDVGALMKKTEDSQNLLAEANARIKELEEAAKGVQPPQPPEGVQVNVKSK
jgi:hypothetical protein